MSGRWCATTCAGWPLTPTSPACCSPAPRQARRSWLEPLNRELFSATSAWFRRQADTGAIRSLPRDLLYAVLVGPAQEFSRHWLAGRVQSSMRTAERVLAQAAWDALRRPEGDD